MNKKVVKSHKNSQKVSDKVTEISEKATNKKKGGSNNFVSKEVDNFSASINIETDEYMEILEGISSEVSEIKLFSLNTANQFRKALERYNSQLEIANTRIKENTKKLLKTSIQFYFHKNFINLESKLDKADIDVNYDLFSQLLEKYEEIEDPGIYMTYINSINPESLAIIQNYKNVIQQ